MNLKDARDNYYFNSGKTSDNVRQLALAGIAVVWIFKFDVNGIPKVPPELLLPLALITFGLAIDVVQYAVGTACWGIYQRWKEQRVDEKAEFKAPREINWAALTFFVIKVVAVVSAYFFILKYVAAKLMA